MNKSAAITTDPWRFNPLSIAIAIALGTARVSSSDTSRGTEARQVQRTYSKPATP